jgi:1-acyl-sn-glycerol-3-phosphate acyltransferase
MRHTPRLLDFVSIVEVFKHPLLGWFYGNMNAFPLDRSKPDAPTVRTLLGRLERGRVVAMFPEGGFRRGEQSVVRNGKIRSGVGRLVRLAGVPLVPAVVINSIAYSKPAAWLPLRRVRYAVAFGPAISHELEAEEIEAKLVEAMAALYARACGELPGECRVV